MMAGSAVPHVVVHGGLQQLNRVELGRMQSLDMEANKSSHVGVVLGDRGFGNVAHRPYETPLLIGGVPRHPMVGVVVAVDV